MMVPLRLVGNALVLALFLAPAPSLAGSLLPLQSEHAAPLPSGTVELATGASYVRNLRFPAFTPAGAIREQDLISGPEMALRLGAGDWAEIQASFEFIALDERTVAGENDPYGGGDARLHTKVRLLREKKYRPALGLRFGTKLPNADRDDRLGTDETDFDVQALASKDFGPAAAHVNLGIAILGNPGPVIGAPTRSSDGQDDLFSYSVALASRPLAVGLPGDASLRLVGEVIGLAGSRRDFDNDRSAARAGVQIECGGLTLYGGASAGLMSASEDYGFRLGLIYALDLRRLFGSGSETTDEH
jgi:hypothetical protein